MLNQIKTKKHIGILVLSVITGLSLLFTVYSESITSYAADAMKLCAASVIPSLFPFMVLSNLASKTATLLSEKDSRKTAIAISVLLGAMCGFPVGAASVAAVYKNGSIRKKEAEYLCALCNNTGPAFVIGVIGSCFWGSVRAGMIFYICQLLAAGSVFAVWYLIFGKRALCSEKDFDNCINAHAEPSRKSISSNVFSDSARIFCNAVADSSLSIIRICGYIVFFKVICDTLRMFMPESHTSDIVYAVIASVLEFTTGTKSSAALGGDIGFALCGFSIGFSGLSVTAQSIGIISKAGLSALPLFRMKIIIGAVCGLMSLIAYRIFPISSSVAVGSIIYDPFPTRYISVAIIGAAAILYAARKIRTAQ